jgi:hypothetical protein
VADNSPLPEVATMALSDHDMIPVGKCPNCGYVFGDDLDYRFPQSSECKCGETIENTTVAEPETVNELAGRNGSQAGDGE